MTGPYKSIRSRYLRYTAIGISILLLFRLTATPSIADTSTPTPTPMPTPAPTVSSDTNSTVAQYGLFETQVNVDGSYKNPFDTTQIDVTAQFTAPDGSQITIPGFWMQPYNQTCSQSCSIELLNPQGTPGWYVRFSPSQAGVWHYTVQEKDSTSQRPIGQGQLTVTPSKNPGFIRVGKNHHYFAYDDGSAYFPVGSNLGWSWSGANGTPGYQSWLKGLHDVGANYARLYADVPWFIGLNWRSANGDYTAAQGDAWRLDTILQTAQQYGIALQIVLVWNQGFTNATGMPVNPPATPARANTNPDWSENPYNLLHGGPFSSAAQFFSTDQGRTDLKRLLHYVVARWGYSTSVFSWEVIDQLDRVSTANPEVASDWLHDMVGYLRQTDPYQHLITAGVKDSSKAALLDSAVLDFEQARFYQRRPLELPVDEILGTLNTLTPMVESADRPVLMTEFSLSPWFEPTADDPSGIHVRETMWAAALSGSGGGAASWWWDTYLFPQNLTGMFTPLAAFSKGIPWNTANLQPVDVTINSDQSLSYAPAEISGYNGATLTQRAPDTTYRVTADGVFPPISSAPSFLYGVLYNSQLSSPQRYVITPPIDTKLTVNVRKVSDKASARLVIIIDGKTQAEMTLSPQSNPASLTVPISAGEHTVVLDNLGDDYLQLDSLEVAAYIAPLRTIALADQQAGIFLALVQNRDYTWENALKNIAPKPVTVTISADNMPPGLYRVELWDPFSGNVVGQEDKTISGPQNAPLTVSLLPISKMLAVKAIRVAEPGDLSSPTPTPTETPRPIEPTPTE